MKRGAALTPEARESHGLPWTQERVKAFLESRYDTRLHMTAILAASAKYSASR